MAHAATARVLQPQSTGQPITKPNTTMTLTTGCVSLATH